MKKKLRFLGRVMRFVLLTYFVLYGVTSILFDHQENGLSDITGENCQPKFIQADSQAELESAIAREFAITLVYSNSEPTNLKKETVFPYQVLLIEEGKYAYRIAATYQNDFGTPTFGIFAFDHTVSISRPVLRALRYYFGRVGSHQGDVEMLELVIALDAETGLWYIESITINQHGIWHSYGAARVKCFRGSPVFYVALGKHAMYPSLTACNGSSVELKSGIKGSREVCNVGVLYFPDTSPEFDIGDREHPVNIFLTSPTMLESGIFEGEDIWARCFYGGWGDGDDDGTCHAKFQWR